MASWGLTYELGHEGNHQVEKTDSLDESETQNGVREQLATEGRVAGNTVEESGEDETDTDTSTSQTDGGGTHTQVLGDLNHGLGDLGGVGAALALEGSAAGGLEDGRGLLALHGLQRGGRAFGSNVSDWTLQLTMWSLVPMPRASSMELARGRDIRGKNLLTSDGSLRGGSDGSPDGRAGGLDGHLGGQAGGEDTGGGHCDDGVVWWERRVC